MTDPKSPGSGDLLGSVAAAMRLNVTEQRIRQLAGEGKLRFRWVGHVRAFTAEDIEAARRFVTPVGEGRHGPRRGALRD